VGRGGDLAGIFHLGRRGVGDLHVEVGGREAQATLAGRQQHVAEDRDGVSPLDDALHVSQGLEQRAAFDRQLHLIVQ
jgi:hypothetical protein